MKNKPNILVGQNQIDEFEDYCTSFGMPQGGAMYASLFDSHGFGSNMHEYLAHIAKHYPQATILVGLDGKHKDGFLNLYPHLRNEWQSRCDKIPIAEFYKDVACTSRFDGNLQAIIASLQQYPSLNYLIRFDYEVAMEMHATMAHGQSNASQWYILAFQKFVRMARVSKLNCQFVFHPCRGANHLQLYPGHDYVDFIGISIFNNDLNLKIEGQSWEPPNTTSYLDANASAVLEFAQQVQKKSIIAECAPQLGADNCCATPAPFVHFLHRLQFVIEKFQISTIHYIHSDWNKLGWQKSHGWGNSKLNHFAAVACAWQAHFA